MRYCYLSRNYKDITSAGGKAKTDIETTMQRLGFTNLGCKQTHYKNKMLDFLLTLTGVCRAMLHLRRDDVLLLQYPVKKYYAPLCNQAHAHHAKVVTVIHDLGSFRRKKLTIEQEIARLNHSDVIIAHNEKMQAWLLENGYRGKVVTLGIFDYLSATPITSRRPKPEGNAYDLFFVGSMSPAQNSFIYDLGAGLKQTRMYLYGGHLAPERVPANGALCFQGFAKDTSLMADNKGDFGLSWYGESLEFGLGKIGEYMAYNNPHKISLYLRCNAPVILWENAGLASFVRREGVGVCIKSLVDLEKTLAGITPDDYARMIRNVERVNRRLAAGKYFEEAFTAAIAAL